MNWSKKKSDAKKHKQAACSKEKSKRRNLQIIRYCTSQFIRIFCWSVSLFFWHSSNRANNGISTANNTTRKQWTFERFINEFHYGYGYTHFDQCIFHYLNKLKRKLQRSFSFVRNSICKLQSSFFKYISIWNISSRPAKPHSIWALVLNQLQNVFTSQYMH